MKSLTAFLAECRAQVESALDRHLPSETQSPERLHIAMRYAVLQGGKRLRAALVYATGGALGVEPARLDAPACALELIHAYSLVHDDLPAMDNDDLRRGRPTCHRAFDEATAILVGDALQTLAFQVLTEDRRLDISPARRLQMLGRLAQASGSLGMAGGQAIDLASTGQRLDLTRLQDMHARKTGALIGAAVALGYLACEDAPTELTAQLEDYAAALGLAFQITDDILDIEGDTATLGKPQGSDLAHDKSTYPALLGLERAKAMAREQHTLALASLDGLGDNGRLLRDIADYVILRTH